MLAVSQILSPHPFFSDEELIQNHKPSDGPSQLTCPKLVGPRLSSLPGEYAVLPTMMLRIGSTRSVLQASSRAISAPRGHLSILARNRRVANPRIPRAVSAHHSVIVPWTSFATKTPNGFQQGIDTEEEKKLAQRKLTPHPESVTTESSVRHIYEPSAPDQERPPKEALADDLVGIDGSPTSYLVFNHTLTTCDHRKPSKKHSLFPVPPKNPTGLVLPEPCPTLGRLYLPYTSPGFSIPLGLPLLHSPTTSSSTQRQQPGH